MGDEFDSWGTSWWFFEIDDAGECVRVLQQYARGQILRYSQNHLSDRYGLLPDKDADWEDFADCEIPPEQFEAAWQLA